MKKIALLLLLLITTHLPAKNLNIKAVVISPVADLLGQSHRHSPKKGLSIDEYYHEIPFSGSGNTCWRIHQLLFNEIVTVVDERGPEVKVKISNFYYTRYNESSLQNTYWMLKKNLLYLDSSTKNQIDHSKFPPPISYQDRRLFSNKDQNVVTLKKPFYDPRTDRTYSAGTRFLAHSNQDFEGSFDRGYFDVYIFDTNRNKLVSTKISKLHCIRNYFKKPEDQIQNFVQVLRSWSYQKEGFIPYVLGGFSWTKNCEQDRYEAKKDPLTDKPYFHRKEWSGGSKIGFDCVGVIGRAAQICEIPFFYKNTLTLMKNLNPLKKGDCLKEGDLITYPGHVMVISNLEKNLIVEARGYDNGNGQVREAPLHEIFLGIESFTELERSFQEKKPISVLDIQGNVIMITKSLKLLKLHSVWHNL